VLVYDPTNIDHGVLLMQWWTELVKCGDIQLLFPKSGQALPQVCKLMEQPTTLLLDVDALGVTMAVWLAPSLDGSFYKLWVRKDKRRDLTIIRQVRQTYELALERYPWVMGITIQPRLLQRHYDLGYTLLGEIPNSFDGKTSYMVLLTRENFKPERIMPYRRDNGRINTTRRKDGRSDQQLDGSQPAGERDS
jgi:hypothetical protein